MTGTMKMTARKTLVAAVAISALALVSVVPVSPVLGVFPEELQAVYEQTLRPYDGESVREVDPESMVGKVLCGYQGWFNAEGDGANLGFHHWTKDEQTPRPGNARIDLWPDMSECGPDERFATELCSVAGKPAEVFSSFKQATVLRHFQWMRQYGIDGVMVQRFATPLMHANHLRHSNVVLNHCREGANRFGRTYAVMYDLSGLGPNSMSVVMDDWRELRTRMRVCDDPAYLRHRGRPVVVVWGVGFNRDRNYTVAECGPLVEFLKQDGCTVMLGVPTGWRTLDRDAVAEPLLHDVIKLADVVSPWTVGRYHTPDEAEGHGEQIWKADLAWCREHGLDYMPVAVPGFRWSTL